MFILSLFYLLIYLILYINLLIEFKMKQLRKWNFEISCFIYIHIICLFSCNHFC